MLLPLLMQLGMLGRDLHDGYLATPYEEKKKPLKIVAKEIQEPQIYEVITAKPRAGATGVLGGDFRNLEIAALLEKARLQDEDESISLLLMH